MTTPENDPISPPPSRPASPSPSDPGMASDAPPSTASFAAASGEPAPPTLEQRFAELEAKHTEVADAYLRAKAEAENTRRRAEEDVAKARKFAIESFADSLLPVKDSLEAAIAMPEAKVEQVLEGVHATLRQLSSALERHKVLMISPPAGTKFDPSQHQAISVVPVAEGSEQGPNTVVAVLQKGYLINDRVLRPALVTVSAPS